MPNIVISNPSNQQVTLDDIVIEPNTSRGVAMGAYTLDVSDTAIVVNNGNEYVPEKILQMEDGTQVIVADAIPASVSIKVGQSVVAPNASITVGAGVHSIEVV